MSRFRTRDETVISQSKRMAGISLAVAFPATRPGQLVLGHVGRRALLAVEGIVMDPIGTMQRTDRLLKTYKRMGQVVGLYHSAIRFRDYKSLASSSSSYQQNGGASGTRGPDMVSPAMSQAGIERKIKHNVVSPWMLSQCPTGYELKKVKGRWMCVRIKHRRK